jgi:hypothetical protein
MGDQVIDVKAAVAAADAYLKSFPQLLQLSSPRLEETEVDAGTGDWLITISFFDDPNPGLATVLGTRTPRVYRHTDSFAWTKTPVKFSLMKHRNLTDLELVENASSIASMLSKYKTRGAVIDSTLMLLLVVGDYDIGSVGHLIALENILLTIIGWWYELPNIWIK